MAATLPTTAAGLLDAIAPYGPTVTGAELTLTTDAPPHLLRLVALLHTGVRSLLVTRPWYGCGSTTATAAPVALKPGLPIPVGITLLCVAGDDRWHRFPASARDDFPALFAAPPQPKEKAARKLAPARSG